jgi:hypothetical protein
MASRVERQLGRLPEQTSHLRPLLEGVVHTQKITVAVHVPSRSVTGLSARFVRPDQG